jgi:hypothetical protein
MSDINITVDSKQVVDAKRDISDLERSFSSAYKSAQTFMSAFSRANRMDSYTRSLQNVAKANQEIINKNLGVTKSYKSAEQSAESFIRVLDNQVRSARAATAALNERVGITGPSATDSGAGFAALEGQMERLRIKYDSVYASSRIYENGLNEINQAHIMGAISSKQHEAALEQLNMEYQQFQSGAVTGMNRFAQGAQQSAGRMSQMGVVVQQTGYQVGDFLVQIQSGTNWMVAFGQQATQLVGVLPMLSGSLGIASGRLITIATGLGIAIPLLTAIGAAFMRTRETSDKAADGLDTLDNKLKNLDNTLKEWLFTKKAAAMGITVEELIATEGIDKATSDVEVAFEKMAKAKADFEAQFKTPSGMGPGARVGSLVYNWLGLSAAEEGIRSAEAAYVEAVLRLGTLESKQIQERLKLINEEQQALTDKYALEEAIARFGEESLTVKGMIVEQERLSYEATLRSKGLNEATIKLLSAQRTEWINIVKEASRLRIAAEQAERIKAAIGSLKDTVINVKVNFEAAFSNFTGKAAEWAGKTWGTMQSIAEGGSPMFSSPRSRSAPPLLGEPDLDSLTGGGGGGGNSQLDALIGQLQTEREVLEAWYAESQTLLQSASDSELSIVGGKHEALIRLEEEYQSKLKAIRDAGSSTALGDASIFFEGMAAIAAAGGNKTVKAMRIFSAAQALINSYVAFTEVLKDPSFIGRPWARFGAAAKALASGLAAVNAIKGGGGGGISGGGSPGNSSVTSSGQQQQAQTVYIDSIEPDALYSGQTLMNLFDAFYNENDRRGKVFIVGR